MFPKRRLYLYFTIVAYSVCCDTDSTARQHQVRKLNATPLICRWMIPPGFRADVKSSKKMYDYSAIAQLVLKRSVMFLFIGTRHKRISAVLAQVRINGTPAGHFEGHGHRGESFIDCPPGTMNTFYYASVEPAAGRRILWHAPVHAGRPIMVYTTFVHRTGMLWKRKDLLRNMILPEYESYEEDKDMSSETFYAIHAKPGAAALEDSSND